jgi:hypothetical protein
MAGIPFDAFFFAGSTTQRTRPRPTDIGSNFLGTEDADETAKVRFVMAKNSAGTKRSVSGDDAFVGSVFRGN